MARSCSEDEWELKDIPRQLAYEATLFDNPYLDTLARIRHARLLSRQTALQYRIRRNAVLTRWIMRRYRSHPQPLPVRPISPLSPMLMDEVIQDGKIVDLG